MAVNYSILVGVDLKTEDIRRQLDRISRNTSITIDTNGATRSVGQLDDSVQKASLSFQAANEIFRKTIEVISAMSQEVLNLDTALTNFKKVSDLNGQALDNYVDKLSVMGDSVARTGKPKSHAPNVQMVNVH